MSILGVVVRTHAHAAEALGRRLAALAGVELVAAPGDGRCVIVIDDGADAGTPAAATSAAATLAAVAQWPEVLNTSLVYEYSGPDSPAPGDGLQSYAQWRDSLRDVGHDTGR